MTAPFSFHCSICIEPFDAIERLPVVLPCGHTFICLPCSKRLKTCMECRKPLFVSRRIPQCPKTTVSQRGSSYSRSNLSTSASASPRFPVTPSRTAQEAPEPLPTPKNLVLLALMEASSKRLEDPEKDYESGDDNEQVLQGIDMMATCGTFVVKATEGVLIDPDNCSDSSTFSTNDKENQAERLNAVETLAPKVEMGGSSEAFVHEDMLSLCRVQSEELEISATFEEVEVPLFSPHLSSLEMPVNRLHYGQTCQVVAVSGGVAKLARNRGYVQTMSSEIVKIGDPRDEACLLEAKLEAIGQQRQHLLRRLDRLKRTEERLKSELHRALLTPDTNPFALVPGLEDSQECMDEEALVDTPPPTPKKSEAYPYGGMLTPLTLSNNLEQSSSVEYSPAATPTHLMMQSDLRGCNFYQSENTALSVPSLGCTIMPSFFDENCEVEDAPSPSATHWSHSPPSISRTVSERPINFRTGMSGHLALTSSSSHVNPGMRRREVRMMGEHRGIGRIGAVNQRQGSQVPNHLLMSPSHSGHIEETIFTSPSLNSL